jgi:hypothetical protein
MRYSAIAEASAALCGGGGSCCQLVITLRDYSTIIFDCGAKRRVPESGGPPSLCDFAHVGVFTVLSTSSRGSMQN